MAQTIQAERSPLPALPLVSTPATKASGRAGQPKLLVVIDRREFVRGCLSSWLGTLAQEFEVVDVPEIQNSLASAALARAATAILGVSTPMLSDSWIEHQVAWLRTHVPNVPVVAIVDPDDSRLAAAFATRLRLQGFIPTTSNMEVAAAALNLIIAGGTYLPYWPEEDRVAHPAMPERASPPASAKLTPRERAVLDLLEQGMANKVIAYRLGMSQSTVKVHVHNIIAKLNVRNRTEAAVTARSMQPATIAPKPSKAAIKLPAETIPRQAILTPAVQSHNRSAGAGASHGGNVAVLSRLQREKAGTDIACRSRPGQV